MKKIIVACGTGIATSTVVVKKIEEMLKEKGIDCHIVQCKVTEIASKMSQDIDLIISTTIVDKTDIEIPIIQTTSFLTGIGMEKDFEKIVKVLE